MALRPSDVRAFDALLGRYAEALLHSVPTLAEAAARLRQSVEDALSDPPVPGPAGRTVFGRLGLDPDAPVRLSVAAVEGTRAGPALVAVVAAEGDRGSPDAIRQGRLDAALAEAPPAVLHFRATATAAGPGAAMVEALRFHLQRLGFEIYELGDALPPFAARVALPNDAILLARRSATGDVVLLRGRGAARALDVALAATPRAPVGALVRVALEGSAQPRPEGEASFAVVDFVGVGYAELALGAARALRALEAGEQGTDAAEAAPSARLAVLEAASDLTAACTDRWRRIARSAFGVELAWSEDGALEVAVALTGRGRAGVAASLGPALMSAEAIRAAPAAGLWRFNRRLYVGVLDELRDVPADPAVFVAETSACAAAQTGILAAAVVALLPAFAPEPYVPLVGENPLLGEAGSGHDALAFALLGFDPPDVAGEVLPRLGVAAVAPAAAFQAVETPLGPAAQVDITPEGPRYTAGVGALAAGYRRRPLAGPGAQKAELALLAFGEGALAEFERVVAPGPPGTGAPEPPLPVVQLAARADAFVPALQAGARSEARAALLDWARLGLTLDLLGQLDAERLRYRLGIRAHLASGPAPK